MTEKLDLFHERVLDYQVSIEKLKSRFNTYSFFRISGFIVFVFLAIWSISLDNLMALAILCGVFPISFVLLVYHHNKIKRSMELHQKLLEINEEEGKRLQHDFTGIYGGEEFVDEKHPYTGDLDVFGRNSLFQLINRAGTYRGIFLLKSWLEKAASKKDIVTRQLSATELKPLVDWRQRIQAYGKNKYNKKKSEEVFFKWVSGADFILNNRFYRILPYLVILFSSSLVIGYLLEILSLYVLLLPFIITGYFLYKIYEYSRTTYEMTDSGVKILESVENMLLLIERQQFAHENLIHLKGRLFCGNMPSSHKINELKKILELLNLRGNQIYHIFNGLFLLDYIFLAKAEKWRANFGGEIAAWFDTIAEFETLSSLAAFAFAHEDYTFPGISDEPFIFRCSNLGHPLIPHGSCIKNHFTLMGRGSTCIITGSNMAGKSTFLRTVGVNAVLAFAGAPVCADSMDISHFLVFSSMRTKDNLEENISSFYAELLRLKMLLEQINQDKAIFYLLDEILKGTNSVDRHIGAESLILQLNKTETFGLVSTHDLELGKLSEKNNLITNYNFSSSIVGDEIVFDYKLHKGICKSTNASLLMAKIGIQIKS